MAEDTEVEETEDASVARSHMWKHEDIYEWLIEEGAITEDSSGPEVIAAFAAKRNAYRKTERYEALVEEHKAKADEERAARAEAREAAKAEREAAKAAKEAEKAEAEEAKAEGKKAPAKKAPAKRPARKRPAKDEGDSPFD